METKLGGDKTHISSAKFSEKISHVLTTRNFGAKMSRKYKISFALGKPCESEIMKTLFQKLENRRTIRLIKILELAFCASWIQLISFEAFPGEFGHKIPI